MHNLTVSRLAVLFLPALLGAQSVRVYSEFRRIDPSGSIVAADRGGTPREILSPSVARNAYASYHVVVSLPPGKAFELHLAQNPENSVRTSLYREIQESSIPDRLDLLAPPASGRSSETERVFCYWLDLWIPAEARPGRIRVEAQLHTDDRWIIYPMELRITAARVPDIRPRPAALPPIDSRSDTAVYGPWRAAFCGSPETPAPAGPVTIRSLIRRNALQDVALAANHTSRRWCDPPGSKDSPEWYLRVRDALVGGVY